MTPEQTLDWLAEQHKSQCNEDRPVQEWIRSMKSMLPAPTVQEPVATREVLVKIARFLGVVRVYAQDIKPKHELETDKPLHWKARELQDEVIRLLDTTPPAAQPAPVPDGYKLVPVEHPRSVQWVLESIEAGNYVSYQEAWKDLLTAAFADTTPPAAPVQEPVCKECNSSGEIETGIGILVCTGCPPAAQRQWVCLTNEERLALEYTPQGVKRTPIEMSFATEAKLKEKNT